jgi:hypothetical protein
MAVAIKQSGRSLDASQVSDVERRLVCGLPDVYGQFLLAFNGGVPEANEFVVLQTRTGSGVNRFYGIIGEGRDGDLLHEQCSLKDRLPEGVIAIGDAEGGNRICLSLRKADYGHVFFWDHELESDRDPSAALAALAPSFDVFLASLRRLDAERIQLRPGQVKRAWINPEFLNKVNQEKEESGNN